MTDDSQRHRGRPPKPPEDATESRGVRLPKTWWKQLRDAPGGQNHALYNMVNSWIGRQQMLKGGAMSGHHKRYEDLERSYIRAQGQAPDRNWRAFLWLATVSPAIWGKFEPYVNIARGTVDFEHMDTGAWSSGEQHLAALSRALYTDTGDVDITGLATMGDDLWGAVVMALELYRGRKSPT